MTFLLVPQLFVTNTHRGGAMRPSVRVHVCACTIFFQPSLLTLDRLPILSLPSFLPEAVRAASLCECASVYCTLALGNVNIWGGAGKRHSWHRRTLWKKPTGDYTHPPITLSTLLAFSLFAKIEKCQQACSAPGTTSTNTI